MAPPNLNDRLDSVVKELSEMQGAIRRLAQENTTNVGLIAKLREELSTVRADLERLKNELSASKTSGARYGASVGRYE